MHPPALAPGTLFADRYRVLRHVATGGMGAVYEVLHLDTERHRALKVMRPAALLDEELRARFLREAKVTARVESEFLVEVFDAGIDAATNMPFLVMELLRGEDLAQRVKRLGPLTTQEVLTYLGQVAVALDKTHAEGIVHRDLKPANLFLTSRDDGSPRVKVLDFGLAKLLAGGGDTATTKAIGTPLYMAPEQLEPGGGVTGATDRYALALIAYTLLVGRAYWMEELDAAESLVSFALIAKQGPVEPPSARAARRGLPLPASFDAWFRRMTARSPGARPATAAMAVRELGAALVAPATPDPGGEGTAAPVAPVAPVAPAPPAAPRAPAPEVDDEAATRLLPTPDLQDPRAFVLFAAAALALGVLAIVAALALRPGPRRAAPVAPSATAPAAIASAPPVDAPDARAPVAPPAPAPAPPPSAAPSAATSAPAPRPRAPGASAPLSPLQKYQRD